MAHEMLLAGRYALLRSSTYMRAAAIFGLGCFTKHLKPFQASTEKIEWPIGMPTSADQADAILLFGGDGTIHRHLSQLVRLGLPVLIVPAGSGNDFARALGMHSVSNSIQAWRKFCGGEKNVRAIDLGVITSLNQDASQHSASDPRYFSCMAGVGLDGEVSRRANRLPRWLRGHGGYALSLAPAIFTFAPFPVKVSIPLMNPQPNSPQPGTTLPAKHGRSAAISPQC